MKLSDLCREDRIIIPLLAKDRDGVLLEIAQALQREGAIRSADELMGLLLEREKQLTTAIGNGVAIPHTRPWDVPEPVLVFGRTALPVDFNSLDGEPVRLIFLLITPKGNISLHLKLLSRISRMMQDEALRRGLLEARSPKDALTCLQNAEADYFDLTS
jgi:mannitol/fructose-specific phosphotransferase system IIA component (Ntr-type)